MNRLAIELPPRVVDYLARGAPVLLLTCGADAYPSSLYSWAVALDPGRIRFGVDRGSSALANLRRDGRAALHVCGPDAIAFLVKGTVRQVRERIEAAGKADMALWELRVEGAKDQSWPGVETSPLEYRWPASIEARMRRMEEAIVAEMRLE